MKLFRDWEGQQEIFSRKTKYTLIIGKNFIERCLFKLGQVIVSG